MAKAEGVSDRTPFQASERNASGLTVHWVLGPQPTDGAAGTLDCNFFRVENQAGVPDEFVIETVVAGQGLIQRLAAELLGGRLHSGPAAAATVSDDYVRAGSLVSLLQEVRP